jgi:hypothetical protein
MAGSGTDTGASLTLADLTGLPDEAARRQRLLDAALAEAGKLAQSRSLAINGVKDCSLRWKRPWQSPVPFLPEP